MTERELQDAVIECARLLGWTVAHFRPARVMRGGREIYETPIAADGKGYPDLTLVHRRHRRLLFVELKAEKGRLSEEQSRWLEDLLLCAGDKVGVHVWRPSDWISGDIEAVLRCEVPVPAD